MARQKLITTFLLALSFLVIYNSDYRDTNNKARIWDSEEREFFKPVDIVWRGKIISTMAGGSCVGLEGEFSNYRQAIACFPNTDSGGLWKFEGEITVVGKWLGITCAYKNTIFGQCIPDVTIEKITFL